MVTLLFSNECIAQLICTYCYVLQLREQELEEQRQIEANKTALAAIGPRKKRRLDDLVSKRLDLLCDFYCCMHVLILLNCRLVHHYRVMVHS